MGTVPDPLRSTKLALIAASEGENSLGELTSPKHQQKQESIERSSNGYPFRAKVHPAGERSLDVNCRAETSMPRGEHHAGFDVSQSSMFSPGSSSLSKEDSLATAEEPGKNPRQEGRNSCNAKDQALTDSHDLMNTEIKEPGTLEDCKMVPGGAGEPLCSQVDDKAVLCTGGSDSVTENVTHDMNSSLIPSHSGDQQVASTAKENVGGSSGPEKPQVLLSAKELGPVSDLGLKAKVCLDADSGGTKKASFHSGVRTQQEPPPKSSLEKAPPQPLSPNETAEEPLPELLKFKDTGTMTVQPESTSADGETVSRTCQDAEVQAVASMESRSASTSPSILAAFLRENLPSEAKQKQEELHTIYRGASGKEQPEIVDRLAVLGQTAPSTGILPEVRIQAPAGAEKRLGAQTVTLQDDLARRQDASCLSSRDNSECPCPSGSTQEMLVMGMEVKVVRGAGSLSSVAQQPLDASVLQITKPIDRVSVHPSDQPEVTQQLANLEAQLPPCSALSEINSKHLNLSLSPTENQLASSSSCPRILESAQALVTNATESSQENQPQIKTLGDAETGPTSCHMGVKSKREGTVAQLGSKEQKMNAIGAPAGAQTVGASVTLQTGQSLSPSASPKLAPGRTESQPSCHSTPGLLAKISTMGKESKLAVPAAPSSAQAVPSPSKKKKDIKPVPGTKVHVKQSKHVRDVVWDEQGMTWEVYGASLDPESLGIAIQNHLQRQIREHEKLMKAQSVQTRKSISSDTSSNKKLKGRQHNVFQSMLQNFRRPNCCVRPTASSVLD